MVSFSVFNKPDKSCHVGPSETPARSGALDKLFSPKKNRVFTGSTSNSTTSNKTVLDAHDEGGVFYLLYHLAWFDTVYVFV